MKQIRKSVFETNSSSTHSVTISGKDEYEIPKYIPAISFGEYGWEEEEYGGIENKLSYFITMLYSIYIHNASDEQGKLELESEKHFVWLKEMIFDYCGQKLEMKTLDGDYYPFGYIDHQSTDTLDEFLSDDEEEFKQLTKDFIFNKKYGFITDNDNH